MLENYTTIKNYILTLTDLNDNPKLDLQILALVDECLAYCYRKDVPVEMELPLAQVIANEFKKRNLLGLDGDVSAYSEGDLSITFGNKDNIQQYNGKLEPFKKVTGAV